MREFICAHGNCTFEGKLPILVTITEGEPPYTMREQKRFCGIAHLALWAFDRAASHRARSLDARREGIAWLEIALGIDASRPQG